MSYFIAVVCFAVGMAAGGFAVFKIGYNLGWEERHKSMILPRNVTDALNKRLDDNEQHHRHSGIDPKKPLWH